MTQSSQHASAKPYLVGFGLSIVLTVIPLCLALLHWMSGTGLVVAILAMAVLQLLVQLFFFMHVREGEKPAYNVWVLALSTVFIVTIVGASIWIMTFNSQVQ